jgi:uncharacterized protein
MSRSSPASEPVIPSGIPCWIELGCNDEPTIQQFYGGLFGWRYQLRRDPATPTGRYSVATLNGVPVGGCYRVGAGGPAGWTIHLAVQNTASTAEWVETLGGRITLGPIEIPERGNILHAVDPSGAPIVFWRPPASWAFGTGTTNTFTGADLNTHDGVAADHFYTKLFNYTSHQIGDTTTVDYVEWLLAHEPVLYRYVMGSEYQPDTPPHWMVYFEVDPARGTDAAAGHALMLGGTVVVQPYDTPFGRMAILADPDGAVFAIIDHTRVLEDWGRAEVDDPFDD